MRNYIYNLIIDDVTDHCYRNCLNFFTPCSRILDVGIGNGIMIERYHELIREKNLEITGIDINRSYLNHCSSLIRSWNLERNIKIFHTPVEHYRPPEDRYFDFILFSMSFMLFADQGLVLDRVKGWVKPGGNILFFQTMFRNRFLLIELIKPKLKYLTTIDFGRVTYEHDFLHLLQSKGISILEDRLIKKEWFKGEYRLYITSVDTSAERMVNVIPSPRTRSPRSGLGIGFMGRRSPPPRVREL